MPVQIDEVVITTSVSQDRSDTAHMDTPSADPMEHERELADKILQIIREKSER